jgi:hypothetical protein
MVGIEFLMRSYQERDYKVDSSCGLQSFVDHQFFDPDQNNLIICSENITY